MRMQEITPFPWLDGNAEEACEFLRVGLPDREAGRDLPAGGGRPCPHRLLPARAPALTAVNGDPQHRFTEADSLHVNCEPEEELDDYWDRLADGRTIHARQVIPEGMFAPFTGKDREAAKRAMQAMMQMRKIDLPALRKAYTG
jgi:predicted 3-demethylubiquinone-9 3-methyltransferase (glyoxalase superfamily)